MILRLWSLCSAILLCSVPVFGSSKTLPAFLWGSGDFLNHHQQETGLQAVYQVSSPDFLSRAASLDNYGHGERALLNETGLLPHSEELVTVLMLGELRRADFAQQTGSRLDEALAAATSPLFLANLDATQAKLAELVELRGDSVLAVGSCSEVAESVPLDALLPKLQEKKGPVSLIICNEGVVDLISAITQQLSLAGRPYLFVYAGQTDEANTRPPQRSLISTSTATSNAQDLCDRKCRIQVRLFEVIILLIFLLVALYAGLSMLHILDTPTRFEQEKKESNRHHD